MGTTTMGVKLDDATRERIKTAATRIDRTPHWLIKQAIFNYLERLESEEGLPELPALLAGFTLSPAAVTPHSAGKYSLTSLSIIAAVSSSGRGATTEKAILSGTKNVLTYFRSSSVEIFLTDEGVPSTRPLSGCPSNRRLSKRSYMSSAGESL